MALMEPSWPWWWGADDFQPSAPLNYSNFSFGEPITTPQQTSASQRGRRPLLVVGVGIGIVTLLIAAAIGVVVGLTVATPEPDKPATAPSTLPPAPIPDPELTISVDSEIFHLGEQIVIDEGSHTFECTAKKVLPGSVVNWDFGTNNINTDLITSRSGRNGDLVDITSTVSVLAFKADDDETTIGCFITDSSQTSSGKRKRQSRANIFIEIMVRELPLQLMLSIDSIPYSNGDEVLLDEGEHTFVCTAINAERDTAVALKFGGESIIQDTVTIATPRGRLNDITSTVKNLEVTVEDCDKDLICAATSLCGSTLESTSMSLRLKVNSKPTSTTIIPGSNAVLDGISRTVTVTQGVRAELNCQVFGTVEQADVTWKLLQAAGDTFIGESPGESLADSDDFPDCQQDMYTKTISFLPVHNEHHDHTFTCIASNSAGSSIYPGILYLNVNVPPVAANLILKVDNNPYTDGSEVVLTEGLHVFECSSGYSRPASTYTWTFGGNLVAEDAITNDQSGYLFSVTSIVNSRPMTISDCNAVVTCTASNVATFDGSGETTVSRSIILKVSTPPSSASIIATSVEGTSYDSETQTMIVVHGVTYEFSCEVLGAEEEADISWRLRLASTDVTDIAMSTTDLDCSQQLDSDIFPAFTASEDDHHGKTLSCTASNSAGSIETTVSFDVNVAPTATDMMIKVKTGNKEEWFSDEDTVIALEGDFSFECTSSTAKPTVSDVSWKIGGTSDSGQLVDATISSDTTITCSASNSASDAVGGASSISIHLDIVQPTDCYEILTTHGIASLNAVRTSSGAYYIYPDPGSGAVKMEVWCDMDTDGGGWTVFQRREDGTVDFHRDWATYKAGFGDVSGEHWLGNDNLYTFTNQATNYQLRIDIDNCYSTWFALYESFRINNEADFYRLTLGAYDASSDAGDSMTAFHHNQKFTTYDNDQDNYPTNCADQYKGGWWYDKCHQANLNGVYMQDAGYYTGDPLGIDYKALGGYNYSNKKVEMKLRPPVP